MGHGCGVVVGLLRLRVEVRYEILNKLHFNSLSGPGRANEKIKVTFPIKFGLNSLGRKIFIPVSLMLHHLIGIGSSVMAVSQTLAWWGTCTYHMRNIIRSYLPYAKYLLAPTARWYSPSFSCTRCHYHAALVHMERTERQ